MKPLASISKVSRNGVVTIKFSKEMKTEHISTRRMLEAFEIQEELMREDMIEVKLIDT